MGCSSSRPAIVEKESRAGHIAAAAMPLSRPEPVVKDGPKEPRDKKVRFRPRVSERDTVLSVTVEPDI
ncbi:fhkC, partial [Symbiodinium sp. KB8]